MEIKFVYYSIISFASNQQDPTGANVEASSGAKRKWFEILSHSHSPTLYRDLIEIALSTFITSP